jgi:acyl-CoA thioesterase
VDASTRSFALGKWGLPDNDEMPFEDDLQVQVIRKHRDGVTVECPLSKKLLNSAGVLHGGVIATIADEAAWHALIHAYKAKRLMTTTELKVNYLRPIVGKRITARAYVLRAGKTLGVTRIDLFDDAKHLSAVSLVTYMLLDIQPVG